MMYPNKLMYVIPVTLTLECVVRTHSDFVAYILNEKNELYENYIDFEGKEFKFSESLTVTGNTLYRIVYFTYHPCSIYKQLARIGYASFVPK